MKQYRIWNHLQQQEQTSATLMSMYVAHHYKKEIHALTKEAKKQKLCNKDQDCLIFFGRLCGLHSLESNSKPQSDAELMNLLQDVKYQINEFIN